MPNWNITRGDRVLLRQLPPDYADLPTPTQDLLDLCLGREFGVLGLDDHGNVELDVRRVVDREVVYLPRTLRVDADCLTIFGA